MNIGQAISERRSHRRFTGREIPPTDMQEILESGLWAPSPKNRQPWRFVACGPEYKNLIIGVLKKKIKEMKAESKNFGSLLISITSIEECSEFLLVYNPYSGREPDYTKNRWKADMLSIGACIQNMILAAHGKDVQTLWICDILYAEDEINKLLKTNDELVAGVAFGSGKQKKIPKRPRTELEDKVVWTE
ncbi:MAG TPA: nitroreductase family protein [Syntrophales bacterium]|nr:nitroreductase family protein [Syntrophales bacterium]HPQ43993.1 nitroreductase family protein [Syntrophales bacterium]